MYKKGKCTKRPYRDKIAAMMAMANAQRKDSSRREKIEVRTYQCNVCHKWHLTSQERRGVS